jgi:hypothetical protein
MITHRADELAVRRELRLGGALMPRNAETGQPRRAGPPMLCAPHTT